MKPQQNHEVYRAAFESANSELAEIGAEIENLRMRKDQVEKIVVALKPFVAEADFALQPTTSATPAAPSDAESHDHTESPVEVPAGASTTQEPLIADPFRRRIDHVLGIGAGIRDVRKYSRQF